MKERGEGKMEELSWVSFWVVLTGVWDLSDIFERRLFRVEEG